ncbi:hypothetical protein FCL47_17075 [Desulfopila sp. IMCC35006]|uniref:hypothetical protein n=1 Tax=Desulfopila sp. IMCC35006 TaxID=2569542 RepID=UPI0010AC80BD|nr:hypothetical protein [Desulfopila sp. IMCC35006]TKB24553.1 hypothetical protein FCL47_17075 [Desulfopila sp. IMCC35006]
MRYLLRKAVLAAVPEVEIAENDFFQLRIAKQTLNSAYAIEEKWEILVHNYLELEKQLLEQATINTVRPSLNYQHIFNDRMVLNACLVNILTSTRLFLDQLAHDICYCVPGDPDARNTLDLKRSDAYDDCFEYRFMEALRNYTQHKGLPIHYFQPSAQWKNIDGYENMEFTVNIFALREFLAEDDVFKKTILAEMPEKVDLTVAARRYVESLSYVLDIARTLMVDSVISARATIEDAQQKYAEAHGDNLLGLKAYEISDGEAVSSVYLGLDWDDVRMELQNRNKLYVNLSRRYASGRPSFNLG